jgi:hypothetical protein
MSKKKVDVSAVAAQKKPTESSASIASGTVQKRKSHTQIRGEAYANGIRHCVAAL